MIYFSIITRGERLSIDIGTTSCKGTRNFVRYLEHTHIVISLAHSRRGDVSIYLVSPMGTRSRVLSKRRKDYKKGSFKKWAFLSTHFWGENPLGNWKLEIEGNFYFHVEGQNKCPKNINKCIQNPRKVNVCKASYRRPDQEADNDSFQKSLFGPILFSIS